MFRMYITQENRLSSSDTVDAGIDAYSQLHRKADTETRVSSYKQLVNAYYDLATVFYEWGWGSSFHFSYQYPFESFAESIRRHEYLLAAQLQDCFGPDKHVLDVGCGIGGPARTIVAYFAKWGSKKFRIDMPDHTQWKQPLRRTPYFVVATARIQHSQARKNALLGVKINLASHRFSQPIKIQSDSELHGPCVRVDSCSGNLYRVENCTRSMYGTIF